MSRSTYKSLLEDLRHNEVKSFRKTLDTQGLPQDDNYYDYDLLMRALRLNRKRMVNYLLKKKCRVNKRRPRDIDGTEILEGAITPLHIAAEKLGWCDIIEKMLKLKARVTDVDADGNTPLHVAFINHLSDRVINLLLNHYLEESTQDILNKDGLGFMHIASMKSDSESVKKFFDVGMSDIYSQVSSFSNSIYAGYSCLHFAVEAGNHEVAKFLCQYEADVYAQDRNRTTPIHLALEKHDVKMIDILFYYDSTYENYVNDFGSTHFMAACAGSDLDVVEQYISIAENGASTSLHKLLNDRVKHIPHIPNAGYTPLHFACEYGRINTVYGLLVIGAGPQCVEQTTHGLTPHNLAAKQQHVNICQLIEQFYYEHQDAFVQLEMQAQQQLHLQQQQQLHLQQQQQLHLQQQQQLHLQQQQELYLQQQQQMLAELQYASCSQKVYEHDLVQYCQGLQITCA